MGENSAIEWTDHSFNPWVGCTAVSQGCDHCYARVRNEQLGHDFSVLRRTSAANWRQPLKWNREAEAAGVRRRVFCASWADAFDNQAPAEWRADLWDLISMTRSLDWLLLTKRPQNIVRMLPDHPMYQAWPWPHVGFGTTAENQVEADRRISHLLAVPAAVRFLSCEPLLEAIDWASPTRRAVLRGGLTEAGVAHPIDWVICGGESGKDARPMHPDWARSLRDQCRAAGIPFFFKQWGEWVAPWSGQIAPELCAGRDYVTVTPISRRLSNSSEPNQSLFRVGKKAAGYLLDGREHRDLPGMTGGQTETIGGQTA